MEYFHCFWLTQKSSHFRKCRLIAQAVAKFLMHNVKNRSLLRIDSCFFSITAWLHVDNVQRTKTSCIEEHGRGSHPTPSHRINVKSCNCTYAPHIQRISDAVNTDQSEQTDTQKVQVIIVTRWRYGSSFTGEIFNQDPNFIYFFEPLLKKVPMDNYRAKVIGDEQVMILHNIMKCNFVKADYKWWDADSSNTNCYWSQDLGGSTLCGFHMKELQMKRSQKLSSHLVEDLCQSRRHVAIKTVRVPDLILFKKHNKRYCFEC